MDRASRPKSPRGPLSPYPITKSASHSPIHSRVSLMTGVSGISTRPGMFPRKSFLPLAMRLPLVAQVAVVVPRLRPSSEHQLKNPFRTSRDALFLEKSPTKLLRVPPNVEFLFVSCEHRLRQLQGFGPLLVPCASHLLAY